MIFWGILGEFFRRIFWEEFFWWNFGRNFWEDFFGRNFLGGFYWEELLSRNYQGIDVLSRFWFLSRFCLKHGRKEGRNLDP